MTKALPLGDENTPSYMTEMLYQLKVRDVMTRDVQSATRAHTLREIQSLMKINTITGVPVLEGRRLVGIISMDDILRALEGNYIHETAEARMTKNVIALEEDMPLAFAISYMEKHHFGRFPVLNRDGELAGILTSRDILVHLLLAMNHEMAMLEAKLRPEFEDKPEPGVVIKEFAIRRFDFETAGKPSTEIKKLCKEQGVDSATIRRIAVACYELEMNQVIHSLGGTLAFKLDKHKAWIIARDQGPGIPNIDAALSEGFSTANEWVRSLGFGAGLGLPNTKRVSDEFTLESAVPTGTTVSCAFLLSKEK